MFGISKWLEKRKKDEQQRLFNSGYDYAAGQLLRHGDCILGKLKDEANNPFDRNQFDLGMESAIDDFEEMQQAMH